MQLTVNENNEIVLPKELFKKLGWDENTLLRFEIDGGCLVLSPETEITVEQFTEYFDQVMFNVTVSGYEYTIVKDGKPIAVLKPFSDAYKKLIPENNHE